MGMFRFELKVEKLDTYGERVMTTSTASILAENLSDAVEKGRAAHNARYDDFRKFWSHRFFLVSVTEPDPVLRPPIGPRAANDHETSDHMNRSE